MVELVEVGKHKLNKEALNLALSEYTNFRDSEDYGENYKWEILEELNAWVEENEITEDTVQEFVELLREKNPNKGSLVHYQNFREVIDFVEDNPERLAELLNQLFEESKPLEDRISNFRDELSLRTDSFAYLLSAYDMNKYAPFKEGNFVKFMKNFMDEEPPNVHKMSVAEKYTLFTKFCTEIGAYLDREGDIEDSALQGQDFIYTTTNYSEVENTYGLKYLYRMSKRMQDLRDNPESIRKKLESLPEEFLEAQEERYQDKNKIGEIRHRLIQDVIQGNQTDIEGLKKEVNDQYDTNIVQNWRNFTIFSQIYVNYYKRRTETYLETISENVVNKLGEDELTSHYVSFQGSQNYPTDTCWLAIYPASKDSHRKAYNLSISISDKGVKYGISAGNDVEKLDSLERELAEDEDSIDYTKILQHLDNELERFWDLNEVEETTNSSKPQRFDEIKEQIERNSQLVFYGAVGTGKTYTAQKFARYWVEPEEKEKIDERVETVTFHPSFSYEDFIEGLTAKKQGDNVAYEIENGIFKEMTKKALEAYREAENKSQAPRYVLIIDEINRGNLPKILGETITLLEDDKRLDQDNEVRTSLSHSGDEFVIPPNLKIIGTMNTADRSVSLVDTAIRRRFRFLRFAPDYDLLIEKLGFEGSQELKDTIREGNDADRVMKALSILALEEVNQKIIESGNLGKGKQIGHSYLLGKESQNSIKDVWRFEILPLLEEYFFSQFQRMKTEIFDGKEPAIIDWEKEEIKDFSTEELQETFETLVEIEKE
jgi:5-methylcytosine-specific restriction protein B